MIGMETCTLLKAIVGIELDHSSTSSSKKMSLTLFLPQTQHPKKLLQFHFQKLT